MEGIMRRRFTKLMSFVLSLIMVLSVLAVYEPAQVTAYAALKTGTYNIDTDKLPYTQEQIYNQLFDINNKVEIDIDMSNDELKKMQDDYNKYEGMGSKSPIYRMADLYVTITTSTDKYTYFVDEVGVRMKGNTSRTSFYDSSKGIYKLVHLKLDFQETFDDEDYYGDSWVNRWNGNDNGRKARKDRTFATLEKIDMKWNRCDDNSYIKEYYAYETYRANGVLAPHTNLASIDWGPKGNFTHTGVYTIYEPIDEIFLNKYLPEAEQGGDLYKVGWAGHQNGSFTSIDSIGKEDEDKGAFFAYDIKTNKKTTDHSTLKNMITKLNGGLLTKEEVAGLIDMDKFLKFAAVSYFMGNPDDIRNNYNNYYVYFLKNTGKAMFIPYDFDRCLGMRADYDPTGDGCSTDNPFSDKALGAREDQKNPVFIYTVDAGGYYVNEYAEALEKVASNKWLTTSNFDKYYNIARNNYSSDVKPSKSFDNRLNEKEYSFKFDNTTPVASNTGNYSFKKYITTKMASFKGYMEDLDKYADISIDIKTPFYLRGTFNGWNVEDSYNMKVGDGKAKYTLTLSSTQSFKVYDSTANAWYGEECVVETNAIKFTTDADGNICLPAGKYVVSYDSTTKEITIKYPSSVKIGVTSLVKKLGAAPIKISELGVSTTGSSKVSYSSSNTKVLKYDAANKEFDIVGIGTAYIIVTANETDKYASASRKIKVEVTNSGEIVKAKQNISVKKSTYKKYYGNKSFKIKASAKTTLIFKSSNKKVATVSSTGTVILRGCGKATISIKAKETDKYKQATKKVSIKVYPKKVSLTSVKSKEKKSMVVKWKRDKKATGYQIIYSTKKNFKKSTKINITKNKTVSKTIKGLKAGKKYYVKVRAYYKVSSKTKYYGVSSKTKSVVVKK